MVAFAFARGLYLPRGRDLAVSCFSGVLTLGIGNLGVVFAETLIPSGIVGLIITISPFWMVGVEALLPGGAAIHLPTIGGMMLGLAGTALLFAPGQGPHTIDRNLLTGFPDAASRYGELVVRIDSAAPQSRTRAPVVAGGVQQLAAGLAVLPLALGIPQHPVHWSARGAGALVYLIIFGSMIGYSSYAYALDKLPVAIVSLHPYVNAVVAVTLGWLIYREPFGMREALAMVIIFTGVAAVKRFSLSKPES